MKKFSIILLSLVLVASCSLDETSYTEIEKNKYINNATEALTVLNGIYRDLTQEEMYGYHLSLYFTLPSDMAKVEGSKSNNFRIVPCNAYTSSESTVRGTWRQLYRAIYDANDFLERLSGKMGQFPDSDRQKALLYLGEARALRALFYFELVRWYGHITLMTDTAQSELHPSEFTQASPEEVYRHIEADLKYAISVLPYASDDTVRPSNSFRFSKGGALGLLTKVYATWAGYPVRNTAKWQDCLSTARTLVDSGKHGLLSSYEQLWINSANSVWDATESLLEVSFYSPIITGNRNTDASGRIGKWNGVIASTNALKSGSVAGNWRVVPTFAAGWKDYLNDKRWKISISDYQYTAEGRVSVIKNGTLEMAVAEGAPDAMRKDCNNKLTPRKWDIGTFVKDENQLMDLHRSNINWYLLRYADILLLYAEALNECNGGPTDAAFEAVNMVRRRGYGLPLDQSSTVCDLPDNLDYEGFARALRDERSYELAFEGHRRQDLIRWGIYYETIRDTYRGLSYWHSDAPTYYLCGQYTMKNKHELLPIPQTEIDLMPQFEQNEGWK